MGQEQLGCVERAAPGLPRPQQGSTQSHTSGSACRESIKCLLYFPSGLRHHSTTQMHRPPRRAEATAVLSLAGMSPTHLPLLPRIDAKKTHSMIHPMRDPPPPPPPLPPSTKPNTPAACRSCWSRTPAHLRIPRPPLATDAGAPPIPTPPSSTDVDALPAHRHCRHRRRLIPRCTRITLERTASTCTAAALQRTLAAVASTPTPAAGVPSFSLRSSPSSCPHSCRRARSGTIGQMGASLVARERSPKGWVTENLHACKTTGLSRHVEPYFHHFITFKRHFPRGTLPS